MNLKSSEGDASDAAVVVCLWSAAVHETLARISADSFLPMTIGRAAIGSILAAELSQYESSLCQDPIFDGILGAPVRAVVDRRGCVEFVWVRE